MKSLTGGKNMTYYIAIGGIGCRTLEQYMVRNHLDAANCFFIDSDISTAKSLQGRQFYLMESLRYGSGGYRNIGRNSVKYEILSQKLEEFFRNIRPSEGMELVFVTTSFGGFGSAVVFELVDYLEARLWTVFGAKKGSCRIISLNEGFCRKMIWPKQLLEMYAANTIEFVNEATTKYAAVSPVMSELNQRLFAPYCNTCLIDTESMDPSDFSSVLGYSEARLAQLDVKQRYMIKQVMRESPLVFISYSSKDQIIADSLVDKLESRGVSCWIATKNIKEGSYAKQIVQGIRDAKIFIVLVSKNSIASEQVKNEIDRAFNRIRDGLKIIPVLLDDTELDDECSYYLCRQEMFDGKRPPIESRIEEISKKVADMLE